MYRSRDCQDVKLTYADEQIGRDECRHAEREAYWLIRIRVDGRVDD